MADYRQIHTSIWNDEWFMDLEPNRKLLFIYCFSNKNASLCGLYKLPLKVIVFETGLDSSYVSDSLAQFSQDGKVHYENGIIWVVNMTRYHESKSPKVKANIVKDIEKIPDCQLKRAYMQAIDTVSIQYGYQSAINLKELKEEKRRETDTVSPEAAAAVFRLYESEIGTITQTISEELKAASDDYPGEWFEPAFQEAARHNKRNWAYVRAILKNWKANGFQSKRGKSNGSGATIEELYPVFTAEEVKGGT